MNTNQSDFIDVHHHVVPPWYSEAVTQNYPDLYMRLPAWSVESDGELMERQGIATAMLSLSDPGVFFGDQALATRLARRYNEFVAALIAQFPSHYGAFGVLPLPDIQAATEEAVYALDTLKLDGIGLLSNYRGFYLSDEGTDELFNELNRRHAVVFLHPAEPPKGTSPQRAIPALSGSSLPLSTLQAVAEPSHILFGSDATFAPEAVIAANIQGLLAYPGFQLENQSMIASRNARALFPRLH
jgi:6-methylsalicylate decarboxylase